MLVRSVVIYNFSKTIKSEIEENKVIIKPETISKQQILPEVIDPSIRDSIQQEPRPQYLVYNLGDIYCGRRTLMKHIGLDIGTRTVVLAFRGDDNNTHYISEINGWWPFERATTFIEKLLDDPNKTRSDGTKRPARWIKLPDSKQIVVLGRDAEEFAYSKNDNLRRPMA